MRIETYYFYKCRGLAAIVTSSILVAARAAESGFPDLGTATKNSEKSAAATSDGFDGITGAPTVTNTNAAPTYPPPTIPPTADAPFMQKSSLPAGTVFICAGAALGFMLACVLLWRAWVAWSIHRSMERVSRGYTSLAPQGKRFGAEGARGKLLKKSAPFYQHQPMGSMISMSLLHNDEQRSLSQAPSHLSLPDKKSLFFSPTASSGIPATGFGVRNGGEYMPSGYYAAATQETDQSSQLSLGKLPGKGLSYSKADRITSSSSETPILSPDTLRDQSPGLAATLLAAQSKPDTGSGTRIVERTPSSYLEDLFSVKPVPQDNNDQ